MSKIVLQSWTMAVARVKHAVIPRWFPIDQSDWCKCTELSEKREIFTVYRDQYNSEYRFFVFAIVFEEQRLPSIFSIERCIFFHGIWKHVCKYNDCRGCARCITKELFRILLCVDAILLKKNRRTPLFFEKYCEFEKMIYATLLVRENCKTFPSFIFSLICTIYEKNAS